ncbi:hypothetical protein NPIL_515161 [Nephila pilipes]|uniref:Uncharacterized protein n=1 Tax=Nephila pilipes TaxID=299642 RepID=A0A8X6PA48_NEPPI|nr:hypothetical protein NPIL_515161 [Nephila pilipes]
MRIPIGRQPIVGLQKQWATLVIGSMGDLHIEGEKDFFLTMSKSEGPRRGEAVRVPRVRWSRFTQGQDGTRRPLIGVTS